MTSENKKIEVFNKIQDFDAVSLYPSAMKRLNGYLKGNPRKILDENKNMEFLNSVSGYFIRIHINKINKNLKFPLISTHNNKGIRQFENKENITIFVDKTGLEDLITFQYIEFDIIDGYYFNDGRNTKITEVIEYIFNRRLYYKKQGNPIQTLIKLLMNSSYGKTIMKPIKTEAHILNSEYELNRYIISHHNDLIRFSKIHNCEKYYLEVGKSIDDHLSLPQIGGEILSMSKRIMNEVICLAEDLKINIYYQDTDSMHIDDSSIKLLSDQYFNKNNRELIGKNMGQFHSDFEASCHSRHLIALGKKSYIDSLHDEKGNFYKHHIRLKGIPLNSVLDYCEKNKMTPIQLYSEMMKGKKVKFDLLAGGKVRFMMDLNFDVITKKEFQREISF